MSVVVVVVVVVIANVVIGANFKACCVVYTGYAQQSRNKRK